MEFGIYTFAEVSEPSGSAAHQRMKDLLQEVLLAEEVGLDVFAVGEHHRPDFIVSSPAVVLAAAAAITKKIKLSSAVTVLSSDDPVRVFQDFATVDLISSGRTEIMAGRGSFIESFPLFGFDLDDYDELFSEKLELLLKINKSERISWKGKHRPPIKNLGIYPRPLQNEIPVWIAVGGTPQSVVRAAILGLPLALAIIGGSPRAFGPLIQHYRNTWEQSGHEVSAIQIGINSHVYIAENSEQAAEEFFPSYSQMMSRIGRERGWAGMDREQFELLRQPGGALLVGSPQEVADKIIDNYRIFKNTRFLAQMSVGAMPHEKIIQSIRLFGTEVVPKVKQMLSGIPV
jgi:probable LLM family oxidoreductase